MDGKAGVKTAHEERGGGHAEAIEVEVGAAGPSVGEGGGRNCDSEDDKGRNAGGEEGGFVGGEPGLLKEETGTLRS